jgi:hypothetical protein
MKLKILLFFILFIYVVSVALNKKADTGPAPSVKTMLDRSSLDTDIIVLSRKDLLEERLKMVKDKTYLERKTFKKK